jgi:hypothetical protein
MGDILGGVFGGGQRTTQETQVDPTTQALNRMRYDQLSRVFGAAQPDVYGGGPTGAYTPSPQVSDLYNFAMTSSPGSQDYLTMPQYQQAGQAAIGDVMNQGLGTAASTAQAAQAGDWSAYGTALGGLEGSTNAALAGTEANRQAALAQREADYARGMGNITDTSRNYINRIATPQLQQQMALQGMEGSGALPTAIAQATAQYAGPMVQQLMSEYMNQGMSAQQAAASAQAAIGQQAMQTGAGLGGQYMGQVGQTYQNLAGNQAALYGQGIGTGGAFAQTLPGAQQSVAMLPTQIQAGRAGIASSMFPMADYSRGLQEQELARRTGLFTTGLTGIPYTPSTTVTGAQRQQPLWNFFGQG